MNVSGTEQPNKAKAQRRRRLRPGPVLAAGIATFSLSLGLLGWQVATGEDPSLGHGKQKPKVVHRTIERTVIRKVYDRPEVVYVAPRSGYDGGTSAGGAYWGGSYSGGGSSGAPSGGGTPTAAPSPNPAPSPPPVSSGAS